MQKMVVFIVVAVVLSCQGQQDGIKRKQEVNRTAESTDEIQAYYQKNKGNELPSSSEGVVQDGKLINGKLVPFLGNGYRYFDTSSYLNGRAFLNDRILSAVLSTYNELHRDFPERTFILMECSNQHGGKIDPHRTHQNGLSIDFMMPLIKDGAVYTALDSLGAQHYLLTFDEQGRYSEDQDVIIDFQVVAHHLLLLDQQARKNGYKISKVIINTSLKDELYASEDGKKMLHSGIYVVQSLTPLINSLHDDHYHVDFEKL